MRRQGEEAVCHGREEEASHFVVCEEGGEGERRNLSLLSLVTGFRKERITHMCQSTSLSSPLLLLTSGDDYVAIRGRLAFVEGRKLYPFPGLEAWKEGIIFGAVDSKGRLPSLLGEGRAGSLCVT